MKTWTKNKSVYFNILKIGKVQLGQVLFYLKLETGNVSISDHFLYNPSSTNIHEEQFNFEPEMWVNNILYEKKIEKLKTRNKQHLGRTNNLLTKLFGELLKN